jgi:anaerobic magnesium-protoporphyrin IX monomethyl ester cyclase
VNNVVVLVYPYFKTEDNRNQKLFNPLSIATLSSQIKTKGVEVFKVDCTFKSFNEVKKEIEEINPKIIGFSTMISMSKNIHELVTELKYLLPNSLYICGGPLATVYPDLFAKEFDIVFRGESDNIISDFVYQYLYFNKDKEFFIKNHDLSKFKGIYVEKGDFRFSNATIHIPEEEYKKLPLADREGFQHDKYQEFWLELENIKATSIMLTRGCPYNCDFCSKPVFGDYFRKRDIPDIIAEIKYIISLGYNYLWISDDCFTLDLKFLEKFCDALIERGDQLNIKWNCLSRADFKNDQIIKKMRNAGCDKVYLGLESGNDEILQIMNKRTSIEDGKLCVKLFKDVGIKTAGFFIVGYPGETMHTIEDTFNFALELDLDEVSFNVPYPLPGSDLFERVSGVDGMNDWTMENEIKFLYQSEFDEEILREKIENFFDKWSSLKKLNKMKVKV